MVRHVVLVGEPLLKVEDRAGKNGDDLWDRNAVEYSSFDCGDISNELRTGTLPMSF